MTFISPLCLVLAGVYAVIAVISLFESSAESEDNAFAWFVLTALFLIAAGVWR